MKRILMLAAVCAVVVVGVGAQLARATVPRAITEHISEVAQWIDRGGITTPATPCGTTCSTLWSAEHAPSAEDPFALELWSESELLRQRLEVLPRLNNILNEQPLTSRTRTVGIRIGEPLTSARLIWEKIQIPGGTPPTTIARGAAEPEEYVLNYRFAGTTVELVRLLRDEWVIGGRYASGYVLVQSFQEECGAGNGLEGYKPPAGGVFATVPEAAASCAPLFRTFSPVKIYTIPSPLVTPAEDYASQTADSVILLPWYFPDWGLRQIEEETTTQFEEHPDDFPVLIKWLDSHLGGASVDPTDTVADIEHFRPQYDYSEGEEFYPQDAGAFTNNYKPDERGHWSYERANMLSTFALLLLAAGGAPREEEILEPLTLELLGARYHDREGLPSDQEDYINARGSDVETYAEDSARMREQGFNDVVYGRSVNDPDDGKVWLQYWIFYYDNSYAGWGNADQHEGDWEMTQVGLDAAGNADAMTFAIHERAWGCSWSDVEKRGLETNPDTPIVYPGLGSHASYPHSAITELPGFLADYHVGDGIVETPPLHILGSEDDWMNWKGRWGASEGELGGLFASPHTPSQQGDKWSHPSRFHNEHLDPTDCEE